ncbi:MAG TPA: restriction endonuclease subunit S [Clostridiales bacterium]|nr:restriction endonuclease subunit S [Clostridiales bacterium]
MKYKLRDICHFPKEKIAVAALDSLTYISTENMLPNRGGVIPASGLPTIESTQAFSEGDVLVSNIRPYFKKIWQASYAGGCSNDVLVFRANQEVDPDFLYYVLSDDQYFNYASATSKGTKMPRGDKVAIMEYPVPNVSYGEQRKISSILKSLDKKIELNKKINHNLQQQAAAMFKEWFIDNSDSSSWQKGTFSDLIKKTISGDWGKDTPSGNNTEMVYCIRGADIPEVRAGNKGKMPIRYIPPKNFTTKRLVDGDIVVEISGGSPTQSTGRAAVVSDSLLARYDKGMVCTNFCKALKPIAGFSMYVFHYWQYLYNLGVFFSYENGTTGIKNLDINGFLETESINIAPVKLIEKFNTFCQSVNAKVYANGLENERLAEIRDMILPKLMSGEISVSEIEV